MGTLYIVATPIGNLEDITLRGQKTLANVDIIACEDTRRTNKLTENKNFIRYNNHTEHKITQTLVSELENGKNIALVSDAGTPLISDPGYLLVRECIKRNIHIVSIPGPSALISALAISGLPTHIFTFYGYPPEKQSQRMKLFKTLHGTCIFYCAPHKLKQTLIDMKEVLGDIDIVICRELTKIHEEIWRGKISESFQVFVNPRGEFVVLSNIPQA